MKKQTKQIKLKNAIHYNFLTLNKTYHAKIKHYPETQRNTKKRYSNRPRILGGYYIGLNLCYFIILINQIIFNLQNKHIMENLTLNGFNQSYICALEAQGLSKCFEAYAENCSGSDIMEIGFNPNSGYVYIALEMEPISICSMLGNDVEYLITDFDNGEEFFFDNYEEAVEFDNTLTR